MVKRWVDCIWTEYYIDWAFVQICLWCHSLEVHGSQLHRVLLSSCLFCLFLFSRQPCAAQSSLKEMNWWVVFLPSPCSFMVVYFFIFLLCVSSSPFLFFVVSGYLPMLLKGCSRSVSVVVWFGRGLRRNAEYGGLFWVVFSTLCSKAFKSLFFFFEYCVFSPPLSQGPVAVAAVNLRPLLFVLARESAVRAGATPCKTGQYWLKERELCASEQSLYRRLYCPVEWCTCFLHFVL